MYRYVRVKYEDLVSDTTTTLRSLYGHLGLAYTEEVEKVVQQQTHARREDVGKNGKRKIQFYSTFRKKNFDHNSWRNKLGPVCLAGSPFGAWLGGAWPLGPPQPSQS